MGKRHDRHVFMPGAYVFPGGRVDPIDRSMPVAASLDPRAEQKLMAQIKRPNAAKARALALAAVRETFEETGLLLGAKASEIPAKPDNAWAAFVDAGILPDLSTMHFVARAVTPPRRKRRYDTRFFTADASTIAHRIDGKVGSRFRAGGTGVAAAIGGQAADRIDGDHRDRAPRAKRPARKGLQPRSAGPLSSMLSTAGGCEICCNAPE